ncbi:hypothetical protein GCM10022261_13580 [Brevibacterium daeguense]|uniref:HAD family hydrolase n=1 Tax=Brevibacterium daeguense TaxID=909936 RepID=A0ABP8EIR5_9MICO|nr:HAD family hydrolase [Brevibacterium daeguense]
MASRKRTARLLVVDLDDTLWTWFDAWHKSFRAFLDELVRLSGIDEQNLTAAIRTVHQKYGTTEFSWLIDELDILDQAVPSGKTRDEYYDPALHAQNKARKEATVLYPGVKNTLEKLRSRGTTVIGYTESLAFWTHWRIQRTGIDGLLAYLYSSEDHDSPSCVVPEQRRHLPASYYQLRETVHRHVPKGVLKPSPFVLQQIIDDQGVTAAETVYVGDSLMKDIAMAQSVEAIDVLAQYGMRFRDPRYSLLQSVSHWTDQMVQYEQDGRPGVHPTPTLTLAEGLHELDEHVAFKPTQRTNE